MRKAVLVLLLFLLGLVLAVSVSAQNSNATIPERNGDYPDPDHPGVRVHVFVHEPKEKPTFSTTTVVCGDPGSTTVDALAGWYLPKSDWTYKVNSSSVPSTMSLTSLADIAGSGFTTWTGAVKSSSKPNLVYAGDTPKTKAAFDGDHIIAFGRTSGIALGVTYVWYYTATHEVAEVDTILNKRFPWNLDCTTDSYNANDILMHEQGHWFGLDDNYSADYVNNTMYGYGSKAETKKITPAQGDIDAINLIYP